MGQASYIALCWLVCMRFTCTLLHTDPVYTGIGTLYNSIDGGDAMKEEEEEEEDEEEQPRWGWQWSDRGQARGVLLHQDKITVTFHPNRSWGCAAIRGVKPLLPNMEHYFEIVMDGPFYGQARMVGIGTKHVVLESHNYDFYPLLGKDDNSWGLNYNGEKFHAGRVEKYAPVQLEKLNSLQIGVYYNGLYGTLSFEINGEQFGVAYSNIYTDLELYPMLCASSAGTKMTLTQSHSSVVSLKAICRGVIRMALKDENDVHFLPLPSHLKSYLSYRSIKPKKNFQSE